MELNSKKFSLQDSAGMQLAELIRQLNDEVKEANSLISSIIENGYFDGKEIKIVELKLAFDFPTQTFSVSEGPTTDEVKALFNETDKLHVLKLTFNTSETQAAASNETEYILPRIISASNILYETFTQYGVKSLHYSSALRVRFSKSSGSITINSPGGFLGEVGVYPIKITNDNGTLKCSNYGAYALAVNQGFLVVFIMPDKTAFYDYKYDNSVSPPVIRTWRYEADGVYHQLEINAGSTAQGGGTVTESFGTFAITPVT